MQIENRNYAQQKIIWNREINIFWKKKNYLRKYTDQSKNFENRNYI